MIGQNVPMAAANRSGRLQLALGPSAAVPMRISESAIAQSAASDQAHTAKSVVPRSRGQRTSSAAQAHATKATVARVAKGAGMLASVTGMTTVTIEWNGWGDGGERQRDVGVAILEAKWHRRDRLWRGDQRWALAKV